MRILFCGDLVGRSGRDVVVERLPSLRRDLGLDLVVANGENAAGGFGITQKICDELYKAGVDCITTGNHVWDQKETIAFIGSDPRLLRPINFPAGTPGKGSGVYQTARGKKVLVANLMGRLFMDPLDDPFQAVDQLLKAHRLPDSRGSGNVDAVLIDFHGEATSEKMAMGHFCDGKVSLVVGTHTHVPTADHMILAKGTAYQTDAGMCGDYDSVIGMEKAIPVARFTRKMPTERLSAALGPGTLCGTFIETEDATGLAKRVEPVRLGGKLSQVVPKVEAVTA
jgi:metallophosphoesterase (TIGR00282 family)